jgi:hypothetical protein
VDSRSGSGTAAPFSCALLSVNSGKLCDPAVVLLTTTEQVMHMRILRQDCTALAKLDL